MEEYITCLYNLVDNYQYGDLKSEMIHYWLVVGIRDSSLLECLQMDAALTLEKAKTAICQRGVISKEDAPTPRCARMVVVPKQNGTVHVCKDLKPSTHMSFTRHTRSRDISKVDDVLAQLAGAKVFTKLDANSGFWQIPLAESSHLLTMFITPFGLFCFNKMQFGISSAPEHFQ